MDINRVFTNKSEAVANFFQQPGVGYYIPLYQREYSWDVENVDQLIEDIRGGVQDIVYGGVSDPIHFMGTLILVTEKNSAINVKPIDPRALPRTIDNVIDGQQRTSTIALLACQLYQKLFEIKRELASDSDFDGLREAIDSYLETLIEVFSVDLRRGNPTRKPIIIRASKDQWTLDGDDSNYKSEVSSYIASFIRAVDNKSAFPQLSNKSLIGKNIRRINELVREIENAHDVEEPDFPVAWEILGEFPEEDLWSYSRPDLANKVQNRSNPLVEEDKQICSLIQLFAFCHYLLQRCCFTIIQPVSDVRAFDMFQSLNATGTPLTAFETFKPLVVNYVELAGSSFKGSNSEKHLQPVDELLGSTKSSASAKSKLTNDFLTQFALTIDGSKLSKQFSSQRRWLNSGYENCSTDQDKEDFISRLGNLALYWKKVSQFNPSVALCVSGIESVPEPDRAVATVCVLYLQKANHKMAHAVLSRFYDQVLRNKQGADREFASVCMAIAAFFTIWRAALPNSGLDDVYRRLLKEHLSWKKGDAELRNIFLKDYFRGVLTSKGIGDKSSWLTRSKDYLRYDEAATICRFALYVISEDTIVDFADPGIPKAGSRGSTMPYLTPQQWISEELKTVEHIAPQNPAYRASWDSLLYENDNYQRIGNLTLLPLAINSSLSNKGWIEKFIYYQHLSETDPAKLADLQLNAQRHGVVLNPQTVDLLMETSTKQHIASIVQIGSTGVWDSNLVEKRSERICEILWDRLYQWLN